MNDQRMELVSQQIETLYDKTTAIEKAQDMIFKLVIAFMILQLILLGLQIMLLTDMWSIRVYHHDFLGWFK